MLKQLDVLIGFIVVMSVVSLLITIITQMISSLLGLRGKNLADALQAMIHKIDPTINSDTAWNLAQTALTKPVISDSVISMTKKGLEKWTQSWPVIGSFIGFFKGRWRIASAIRPDELLGVIKDIATPTTNGTTAANQASSGQADAARSLLNALRANTIADTTLVHLEKWLNSAQDRAEQWFAMHTKVWTVLAAFLMAFVLQLDAIQLLQRISTDPDVRAKLVNQAESVQKQGITVLQNTEAPDAALNSEIVTELRRKYPNVSAKLDHPPHYSTLADVDGWIRTQLPGESNLDAIVEEYNQTFFQKKFNSSSKSLSEATKTFEKTGLPLLPMPYPKVFNDDPARKWWQVLSGEWSWPKQHLLGILISAALLSLGAPFWFNLLKSVTSLRPKLVDAVEKDPKQIPEKK
jgi:hypothetical protein